LIKGYTINKKRLQEQHEKWKELQQTVEFLKTTVGKKELSNKETQGLLNSLLILSVNNLNQITPSGKPSAIRHSLKILALLNSIRIPYSFYQPNTLSAQET